MARETDIRNKNLVWMKLSIIKSSELAAWQCRDFQLTLAAVVATPPRYNKRKLQHHYEEEMFP